MHGKYFLLLFVIITVLATPVAGSLTKISAGAPVYVGEKNIDISSGLQGCRVLDWWAAGADMTDLPSKNVTIIASLDDSEIAHGYTISPQIYAGSEGSWYCEGKQPLRQVFEVIRPQISVRFWDTDSDKDITGMTVPITANITYRIDTNLDKALQVKYRPEVTPLDSFYTITLTDPYGTALSSIYTGNFGNPDTKGILLEKKPFISASPYFWKDGSSWDRTSRNIQGGFIYPEGTYTVTVSQDLNHMQEMYPGISPEARAGMLDASATVTFFKPVTTPVQTVSGQDTVSYEPVTSSPPPTIAEATMLPTLTTAPQKTTYAPQPSWVILAALGIAMALAVWKRE